MAKAQYAASVMVREPVPAQFETRVVRVEVAPAQSAVYEERIRLELNREEATAIYALCGIVGGIAPKRDLTDRLYEVLQPFAIKDGGSTWRLPEAWKLVRFNQGSTDKDSTVKFVS
jgi:hypothetical protein